MKQIVFAEDDPGIRDAVKLILEADGYEVKLLVNGDPIIKNEIDLPDLFILDKQLTGVDGLEVCTFLKSQEGTKHIPVVMLSANPHIEKLSKAAGADAAIEKPFRMRDFRQKIAEFMAAATT